MTPVMPATPVMPSPPSDPPPRRVRHKDALGRRGEDIAAAHLERCGVRVLARNWRCREGEIDIVAHDAGTLVAVEVKTRTSLRFGSPLDAVTPAKLRRLRRLARSWTAEHGRPGSRIRIDAMTVLTGTGGRMFLRHHRGIG
ncbi:YraN family protein [Nocardiopsis mangrovi]|uniref:UPF0102 protein ACFO4E_00195 n=1 Tax=Nocardiopsis mangrovi TaxID=1179818 RepID=A0ABV9DMZ7_9ACTN